jgi:hypothetical protein
VSSCVHVPGAAFLFTEREAIDCYSHAQRICRLVAREASGRYRRTAQSRHRHESRRTLLVPCDHAVSSVNASMRTRLFAEGRNRKSQPVRSSPVISPLSKRGRQFLLTARLVFGFYSEQIPESNFCRFSRTSAIRIVRKLSQY